MESEEWNEYTGNLDGNPESAQNQCDDAGNQMGNLGIALEMTWNCSGNDKLKEWKQVEIIENELIPKNLVPHI